MLSEARFGKRYCPLIRDSCKHWTTHSLSMGFNHINLLNFIIELISGYYKQHKVVFFYLISFKKYIKYTWMDQINFRFCDIVDFFNIFRLFKNFLMHFDFLYHWVCLIDKYPTLRFHCVYFIDIYPTFHCHFRYANTYLQPLK